MTMFFRAYLFAYLFWLEIPLGCFAFLMMHNLTEGKWGYAIRDYMEAGARTLIPTAILFLPVLLGMHELYPWVQSPPEGEKKLYLNMVFFVLRAAIYFGTWIWFLHRLDSKPKTLSGPGLLVLGFTASFASFDWLMSLEPRWYSTVFGMIFLVAQGLGALSFCLLVSFYLRKSGVDKKEVAPKTLNDLGNILLAVLMVWAYTSFIQYLIIWSGNLPQESTWFVHRSQNGWQWVALALVVFQFAAPFFALFFRSVSRDAVRLSAVAALALVFRFVDLAWLIFPSFSKNSQWQPVSCLLLVFGIGAIWLFFFFRQLSLRMNRRPNATSA